MRIDPPNADKVASRALPGPGARAALLAIVLQTVLVLFGGALQAAPPDACRNCSTAKWQVVESANFRVLSFGTQSVSRETIDRCEALRANLARQWLGPTELSNWTPKCDLVLHATQAAYLREVGHAGRSTVASSLIDANGGRISLRRIDVLAVQSGWESAALAHELTHVVLAGRFSGKSLPRWIDEGVAILADPTEKQQRHFRDLKHALASRSEFRVVELLELSEYPAAQRWGTFYGQSASLVQYLVDRAGEGQFIEFVQLAQSHGHEHALRNVYGIGIAEFERAWRSQVNSPGQAHAAKQSPASSRGQGVVAQPVSARRLADR